MNIIWNNKKEIYCKNWKEENGINTKQIKDTIDNDVIMIDSLIENNSNWKLTYGKSRIDFKPEYIRIICINQQLNEESVIQNDLINKTSLLNQ